MYKKLLSEDVILEGEGDYGRRKLIVTCFGEFKVIFTETDLTMKWRTKKAKELFAYLINIQGKSVNRKTLVEKLWIEKEEDYSIAILHNIIYNLRKNLEPYGLKDIIEYNNGNYRIKIEQIIMDLQDMLLVAKAVEEKDLQSLKKQQRFLLDYKGRYMENIEADWVVELAEYFEVIHIKGCFMIAKEKVKEKKPEEAIPYLDVGLRIDMYSEKLAALLIRCYGELRQFKNMKSRYNKYTEILRKDLGIEHSEILESAYADYTRRR